MSLRRPSDRQPGSRESSPTRINRLLAAAGFGSRRQVESMIREGRVMVDGEVTTDLSTTVEAGSQKVHVDGVVLRKQKLVYYAVNKPSGVVTTNSDPQGRARVVDLVPRSERVFPVGRLDRSSEGLILLTNDGELAQKLAHPRFGVKKVYRVTVAGQVTPETMRKMRQGIYIAEGLVKVDGARVLKARHRATEMEITLREGKNREIRRILARLGHKVQQLRRIAIGPLRLGEMPAGAYRPLSHLEIKKLGELATHVERAGTTSRQEDFESGGKPGGPRRSKGMKPGSVRGGSSRSGSGVGGRGKPRSGASRTDGNSASGKTSVSRSSNRSPPAEVDRGRASRPIRIGTDVRVGQVIGGDEEAPSPGKRPRDKSHVVTPRPKKSRAAQAKARAKGKRNAPKRKSSTGRRRSR